jgi:dTDP-4-dehydrorhamnose 3,5-epimerase
LAVQGEVFDVAVDLRKDSPTYGRWVGEVLTSVDRRMLWIPPGFAHGFCALSDEADVLYKVAGGEYAPELERGIAWNDPEIGIDWPVAAPFLAEKDATLPPLREADHDFVYGRTLP